MLLKSCRYGEKKAEWVINCLISWSDVFKSFQYFCKKLHLGKIYEAFQLKTFGISVGRTPFLQDKNLSRILL